MLFFAGLVRRALLLRHINRPHVPVAGRSAAPRRRVAVGDLPGIAHHVDAAALAPAPPRASRARDPITAVAGALRAVPESAPSKAALDALRRKARDRATEATPEAVAFLIGVMRGEIDVERTFTSQRTGRERTEVVAPTVAERMRAAELIIDRALGKPKETLDVNEGVESAERRAVLQAELLEKLRRALPPPEDAAIDVTATAVGSGTPEK